ncbi:hypothetical protein RHOFW510R12_01150 [Rhodanobacter sp. FW510-R12]|uniref:hypothetical protein n=1 Tax=Rhodanobacter thiooxydans TaxID=416169 RepID=UPI00091B3188|nr:hypothetical protein [Rhodanobacter thiooxydans]UJJ56654.1 hypothetical protein LRK53_18775 [Rhodanobacter thiooxydans]
MTHALWQRDFDDLRSRRPTRWAPWVGERVIVVPPLVGRLFGLVTIAFGRLMVSQAVLDAPAYVRRFLLARAWGRVVRGHLLASVGVLLCGGAAALIAADRGFDEVALAAALSGVVWIGWLGLSKRLTEADAVAASLVGDAGVRAGRRWRRRR